MVLENTGKFGNISIGIHGQELPKFAESPDSKEWWKFEQGKRDPPSLQSRLLLKQNQKFWAKNDINLLTDVTGEEMPIDVFKSGRVPIQLHKPLPEKPNLIQHVADKDMKENPGIKIGYQCQKTWSTNMIEFGQNSKSRLFDRIVANAIESEKREENREKNL